MAVLLALLLDACLGEPSSRFHPVCWMGKFLEHGLRRLPADSQAAFRRGTGLWLLGVFVCLAAGILLEFLCGRCGRLAFLPEGVLLWPLFSGRLLLEEVEHVETALRRGLDAGRAQLSRIVSRDTSCLSESSVRAAALESLFENLTDSVIAPFFWFMLLGLPGALIYRFANTADACWGYRDHREWFGKTAARADDAFNWLPARLAGLALCPWQRWDRLAEEAARTPSPNGGWTMGALALRSGLKLEKPGVYELNPSGREPTAADTARALILARRAILSAGLISAILAWCLHA